jgi:HSP20 family protein
MAGEEAYNPAVDVVEETDRLVLIADLPGVPEKDLKIEFVEGGVVLTGRRAPAGGSAKTKLRRAERPAGQFSKSVPLPRGLDVQNAKVRIEDGVLTLTIPRLRDDKEKSSDSPKALKAGSTRE